jgi:hypothetical protein
MSSARLKAYLRDVENYWTNKLDQSEVRKRAVLERSIKPMISDAMTALGMRPPALDIVAERLQIVMEIITRETR